METATKQQIKDDLAKYVDNMAGGSANKASKMLGVSNAYLSKMLGGKWENISDGAWWNVQKQVSNRIVMGWHLANTKPTVLLTQLLDDAKDKANTYGVIANAGSGKTFTAKQYSATRDNVFLVCCNDYFNRKTFLGELLKAMGKDASGYTVYDMMDIITNALLRMENPLIILDEADKLSDNVLYFFISLYNKLEYRAGLVLMATRFLQNRIERGFALNRKGYEEIKSRIGGHFVIIPAPSKADQIAVIHANGIHDEAEAIKIANESEGDMRRVARLVHVAKRKKEERGAA